MPYRSKPPMRSARSKHGHPVARPIQLVGGGQAGRPRSDDRDAFARAGPEADERRLSPSSNARSMIVASTALIVTAELLMPRTQDPSQGAGHSRPVHSGKLFVACSRSIAASHLVAIDEVVPIRNQIAERAALMTERDTAIHAAGRLTAQVSVAVRQ